MFQIKIPGSLARQPPSREAGCVAAEVLQPAEVGPLMEKVFDIFGGYDIPMTWKQYRKEHFRSVKDAEAVRAAILGTPLEGATAGSATDDVVFRCPSGNMYSFSRRAWGDLQSALAGRDEHYTRYV